MTKPSQTLMIQGTTSDAGKSTLVAAICRVLSRKNIKVAPFKPQNMALNSAVTSDGGEIGRAQAVQAHAANIEPEVDFNPILLKPNSDTGAQVIVHGKALTSMEAQSYHDYKKVAMQAVLESHTRLQQRFDYIVVEGAGSPAEINLREGDIANMGFAEQVDCPVIIVADIDRGGVFAHLVGTLELLSQSEQQRVVGFVINRFRGDIKLLESGLDWLEQKTGKPVLGVLPYLHGLSIASEDAVDTNQASDNNQTKKLNIVVPVYPRMSNHTDFDALRWHPEIDLQFIYPKDVTNFDDITTLQKQPLPPCDLIVLPGSKNVQADLAFLKSLGWHDCINKHLRYGGKVIGICGGMQMLGNEILDPDNIESDLLSSDGLGLLPFTTKLTPDKTLTNVATKLTILKQTANIEGYEIHAGISTQLNNNMTAIFSHNESLGFESQDQQIIATYLHGLFDCPDALSLIMKWAGANIERTQSFNELQNNALNTLADSVEQHLDMAKIITLTKQWNSHEQ
ncbi:cobyric acid synthase [Thalassotalea nanhaiensis]|uniref:Cobyric acid synthase n=1 Tax=Thalassotalea nanhaiensis TaxID=3065648 RepID=A0ABY9TMY1_9GAMM|nr:cobyric acid synthase [Colwelliaceae bacterium SQ345]